MLPASRDCVEGLEEIMLVRRVAGWSGWPISDREAIPFNPPQ
jgi:hypothetical protein